MSILVRHHEAKPCILLFQSRELAEAHIGELLRLDIGFRLHTDEIADRQALRGALANLSEEVNCALWDSGDNPPGFDYVEIPKLLERDGE